MKSIANLPSEARPVGCAKKVIPYGGFAIRTAGVAGAP
jgi:hypothetical protein